MKTPATAHKFTLGLSGMLLLGACGDDGDTTQPQPDSGISPTQPTIAKAVDALGGEGALEALTSFRMTSRGGSFISGQGVAVDGPSLAHGTYGSTVSYRMEDSSWRVDYTRQNGFVNATLRYSEIVAGNVGYISGIESLSGMPTGDMPSTRLGSIARTLRLLNPHIILAEVLAAPGLASRGEDRIYDGEPHERLLVDDDIAQIELWIHSETGTLARLVTMDNHHLFRDQELAIVYQDWTKSTGDLLFPANVSITRGSDVIMTEMRSNVEENPSLDGATFVLPPESMPMSVEEDILWGAESSQHHQEWASLGIQQDQRYRAVVPTELAPGVFHLTGGSHHSMAVEQADGIVIVEAPLYPERSASILSWLRSQFPGKSVTHVIATHHHADHSAGLREFVAAGAQVVIGEASVAAFEAVFRSPSTVQPDTLAGTPNASIDVRGVAADETLDLDDSNNRIEVRPIPTVHSNDMLLIFVETPDETFLFESDLYNPGNGGSATFPGVAEELLNGINTSSTAVSQLVGGHGGVAPLSELEAFVNR